MSSPAKSRPSGSPTKTRPSTSPTKGAKTTTTTTTTVKVRFTEVMLDQREKADLQLALKERDVELEHKLNTLIAVIEVACAKVRQSLAGPDPDVDRLSRIHKNLKETLGVCMRAKRATVGR